MGKGWGWAHAAPDSPNVGSIEYRAIEPCRTCTTFALSASLISASVSSYRGVPPYRSLACLGLLRYSVARLMPFVLRVCWYFSYNALKAGFSKIAFSKSFAKDCRQGQWWACGDQCEQQGKRTHARWLHIWEAGPSPLGVVPPPFSPPICRFCAAASPPASVEDQTRSSWEAR